jgi:predicted transcriptional regulator
MQEFGLNNKRAERIVAILRQLVMHQALDTAQIAVELATTARTIRNAIDLLVTKGWVESSGTTKGRAYKLTEAGKKWVAKRF